MEAVRPQQVDQEAQREVEPVLPPPPAPFPVDLVRASQGVSGASGHQQDTTLATPNLDSLQRSCVQALSLLIPDEGATPFQPLPQLSQADSRLAGALTDLLDVSYELEALGEALRHDDPAVSDTEPLSSFEDVTRQMRRLQSDVKALRERGEIERHPRSDRGVHPAIEVVRRELAWARVDVLSALILELIAMRGEETSSTVDREDQPPAYEHLDESALPPRYQSGPSSLHNRDPARHESDVKEKSEKEFEEKSQKVDSRPSSPSREKLLMDLDDMTTAIERLQHISPRLDAQRSELRQSTLTRTEIQARNHRDKMREMDEIWRLIERTHGRRRSDGQRADAQAIEARREQRRQRFFEDLVGKSESNRLENQDAVMKEGVDADTLKAREERSRDSMFDQLVQQGEAGRFSDQDADLSVTDRQRHLDSKRRALIDRIVEHSSSGRYHDQEIDLNPSNAEGERRRRSTELVTIQDFFRDPETLASSRSMDPDATGHAAGMDQSSNGHASVGDASVDETKKTGTFKKIAGMVRRSSFGLGLKTPPADLNTASYVAEYQENIQAVQISLHGTGLSLRDDLYIETDQAVASGAGVEEAVVLSKRDPSLSLRLPLPSPVMPCQTAVFQQIDVHLETKLVALRTQNPNAMNSLNTSQSYPLAAPELRALKPKALCCATCDREVAQLSKALRSEQQQEGSGFKDLPSEHWAEMLEIWMCHDDPAFTAKLAQTTTEGFWPTQENVLVGGSYLLVHPEEAKHSALVFGVPGNDEWGVMKCVCGRELGKKRSKDARYGAGTVRFSKWAVALLREDDDEESVEPIRLPLSLFIMSDLLELVQAHATFRFVISDQATSETRLLIWIFNPSIKLSYRRSTATPLPSPGRRAATPPSGIAGGPAERRSSRSLSSNLGPAKQAYPPGVARTIKAAKILYKVIDGPLAGDIVPGWGSLKSRAQVENLSYPKEVCSGLIEALRESSLVLPHGQRMLMGLEVGFLERL